MTAFTKTSENPAVDRAEEALGAAGRRHGFRARQHKLDGVFYIVTRVTGEELDRAYRALDIDLAAVRANYPAWRAAKGPEGTHDAAVHYYLEEGRDLASPNDDHFLARPKRDVLDLRRDGKPCGAGLSPEQIEVLKIAERLGCPEPE